MEIALTGLLLTGLLAVTLAGLVHGTLGVGFPMVATPIVALATDMKTAVLLILLPTLAVNVVSIAKGGHWSESLGRYWPSALWVLLGSVLGSYLLVVSDPAPFRLVLAVIIFIYLFSSTINRLGWNWVRRYPRASGLLFGVSAGLLAGSVNVAVPILIIYFTELHLATLALVQILNLCFMAGKLAQVGVFGITGLLTWNVLLASLPLALMAILALFGGIALRSRIDAKTYRRWLRRLLFVIAVVLIAQWAML